MESNALLWEQIKQLYEYLRFVGTQGMIWFAFGCTINATSAWALLNKKELALHTNMIPWILVVCNLFAAVACFVLMRYYASSNERLRAMLGLLPWTMADDRAFEPVFPLKLYQSVSILMIGVYLLIASGWAYGILRDSFTTEIVSSTP